MRLRLGLPYIFGSYNNLSTWSVTTSCVSTSSKFCWLDNMRWRLTPVLFSSAVNSPSETVRWWICKICWAFATSLLVRTWRLVLFCPLAFVELVIVLRFLLFRTALNVSGDADCWTAVVTTGSVAAILAADDGSWQEENETGTLICDTRSLICEVPA